MRLPDNSSPAWPLLRLIVVVSLTVACVSLGYQVGFVARSDLPIVLTIAGGLLGVDVTQFFFGRK
jgi:hypothetical protein